MPRDELARKKKNDLQNALDRRIKLLERNVAADTAMREQTAKQQAEALIGCLTAYGNCLATGDTHDMAALFRLVALWYKSPHDEAVNKLVATFTDARGRVPSAKFLPLTWQLVARLEPDDGQSAGFQPVLHALVGRLARDHPYHALNQLLALRQAAAVGEAQLVNAPLAKAAAARSVVDSVRASSPRVADIISQTEAMVAIYTKIALISVTEQDKKNCFIPVNAEARRMGQLPLVPVMTVALDVDPSCTYKAGSFPSFTAFVGATFGLPGGVNAPKKVVVLGSDGRHYTQLAKAKDDLRQDAVMQQVFGHATALLRSAPDARARLLRMHTCVRARRWRAQTASQHRELS
jgi:hypothetical protein